MLEVTVYDEDKDHKYEFLGKVKIPLLRIQNNVRRWYLLKDKKLRVPAKGDNPQIMLEMFFVYNKVSEGDGGAGEEHDLHWVKQKGRALPCQHLVLP